MADVVVITRGTEGVGRALARRFARQGAKLAILGRERDQLRETAAEVIGLGATAALGIPCDVDDPLQIDDAAQRIEVELGPIDVWVDAEMTQVHRRNRRAIIIGAVAVLGVAALLFGLIKRAS